MPRVNVDVPSETHTGLKDIKNHNEDQPDTVKECVVAALEGYVERHGVGR